MESPVKPYKINISDSKIEALKNKLKNAEFPDDVPMSDSWQYGAPISHVKRLVGYWKDEFDWRAQEAALNLLPQFTTVIEVEGYGELEIHFVHKKSCEPGAIPLLFCHGWPGSFIECQKILPLLTEPNGVKGGPSFNVVAPSLPNFGFSQGVTAPGFGYAQYAECVHKLMARLGYDKYVTQGGDFGASITREVGARYPNHCLASHFNIFIARAPTPWKHPLLFLQLLFPRSGREKAGAARSEWFQREAMGYCQLQGTRPASIGLALADSPTALLGWIYERFHDWTDDYPWTDDEILTWISIYQFSTAGPAASVRIYYETEFLKTLPNTEYNPSVRLGLSIFPKEFYHFPKPYRRTLGPVVFEAEHDEGGHFAAWEQPDLLAGDLRRMFGKGGGAYDIAQLWN